MTIGIHSAILIKEQKMILKDALLLYVSDLQKKYFGAKIIDRDDYLSKMKEVEEIVKILHLNDLYKYASWRTCTHLHTSLQTHVILSMFNKDIRLLNKVIRLGESGKVQYTDEELIRLKKKRNQLRDWKQSAKISQSNGFGNYEQKTDSWVWWAVW